MRSPNQQFPIPVAIAEADLVRCAECERLAVEGPRFRWTARTSVMKDVLPMVARHRPRVLMLGPSLCDDAGYPVWALRAWYPQTKVVLLPARPDQEDRVLRALRDGASAYLTLETLRSHLCDALCDVANGETWVPRRMLGRILDLSID